MILFYILVWSMPLTNHWLFGWGVGDFTIVKFLALACVPVALARLATHLGYVKVRVTSLSLALLIYTVIALFSYFYAHGGGFALADSRKAELHPADMNIFSMLLFFVLVLGLIDSMARLHKVLLAMIGSVGFTSVYVIRDWLFNRSIPDYRPGGVSGDANYFALCAAASLVLALHLVLSGRPRREQLFLCGCLTTTSIAFLMAASRGGFLGLAVGLLYLTFRSGRGLRNLVVLSVLMAPLVVIVPNSMIQRFTHPTLGDEIAVRARKMTWMAGLRMVEAHPLLGVGLGQFERVVIFYEKIRPDGMFYWSVAHNTYIEVAGELGIPGLLAYLALLGISFRAWGRFTKPRNRLDNRLLREISVGFRATILTAATCAIFISAWWLRFFWLVQFLAACLPAIERSLARESHLSMLQRDLTVVRSGNVSNGFPAALPGTEWSKDLKAL